MKKRLLLGVMALGAASMLCGFDSAETAESLEQKMQEANISFGGFTASIDANLDAAVNVSDGTTNSSIPVTGSLSMNADYALEPFAAKANATINFSALTESGAVDEEMYMVTDESGALKVYANVKETADDAGEWAAFNIDNLNMEELLENAMNASGSFNSLSDLGLTLELAPEAADVNGTECYLLSTTIDSLAMTKILAASSEMTGQEIPAEVSSVLALLDGLKLNLEYYVDTATYQIVKMHMDMNDSDLSIINQLITAYVSGLASEEAPASTVELVLNDASIDALCSFGDAPAITVPQEALDAEASGGAASLEDLMGAAQSTVY